MPTGIYISGIPKRYRERTPDVDVDDEFYELYPEMLEEDLREASIPLLKMIKHFPWHNSDYTIWLDNEFGDGRPGYSYQEPASIRDDILIDDIPELSFWVCIRGKTHIRHIGLCSTIIKADEVKLLVASSSRLEPMMEKESQFWIKKDVRDSATDIKKVIP